MRAEEREIVLIVLFLLHHSEVIGAVDLTFKRLGAGHTVTVGVGYGLGGLISILILVNLVVIEYETRFWHYSCCKLPDLIHTDSLFKLEVNRVLLVVRHQSIRCQLTDIDGAKFLDDLHIAGLDWSQLTDLVEED